MHGPTDNSNGRDWPPPVPMATAWTPDRQELYAWFLGNAPSLAGAYEGAVRLLSTPSFPGRVHFVSHAVRDICNRLPDFLGSVERKRLKYDHELDKLAEVWPDVTTPSIDDYGSAQKDLSGASVVEVPHEAAIEVSQLIEKHKNRQTNRDVVTEFFRSMAEATPYEQNNLEPIVDEFLSTADWFMKQTHLGKKLREEPDPEEITRCFEQFERLSLTLIRGFFTTMDELDDLLQQANATAD